MIRTACGTIIGAVATGRGAAQIRFAAIIIRPVSRTVAIVPTALAALIGTASTFTTAVGMRTGTVVSASTAVLYGGNVGLTVAAFFIAVGPARLAAAAFAEITEENGIQAEPIFVVEFANAVTCAAIGITVQGYFTTVAPIVVAVAPVVEAEEQAGLVATDRFALSIGALTPYMIGHGAAVVETKTAIGIIV